MKVIFQIICARIKTPVTNTFFLFSARATSNKEAFVTIRSKDGRPNHNQLIYVMKRLLEWG